MSDDVARQTNARERSFDFLIIGGGAAGVSCAETIRRRDHEASIAILSAENELPYSRVSLPEYIKGDVAREEVFLRSREYYIEKNIEILLETPVVALNREAKWVVTRAGEKIHFGALCIATGGTPRKLAVEGDDAGIFYLHSLKDADALREQCRAHSKEKWLIVGGGYIGLEFANIVHHYGSEATILTPHAQLFSGVLTREGAGIVSDALTAMGITVIYGARVDRMAYEEGVWRTITPSGTYAAAHVGVGIGIDRGQEWFWQDGAGGGMLVDETFRVTSSEVYGAGDIAVRTNAQGEPVLSGAWATAVQMGMVAGTHMTGGALTLSTPAIYAITIGGVHISCVGDARSEGAVVIVRVINETSRIEFYFRGDVLVGMTLINAQSEIGGCIRLLMAHGTLGERAEAFADASIPLTTL